MKFEMINPNNLRHSTIGLVDDMALTNSPSQCQIERRHSLTEKSPREYLDKHEDGREQFEDMFARKQQQEEVIGLKNK
jgi:hypothetical protein